MGSFWSRLEIGGVNVKTDLQKEMESAVARRDALRIEFIKTEGAISFLQYLIEKEREEEVKG